MSTLTPARTYNQSHMPRKYTGGKRRVSIYWTWSYPWESNRDPASCLGNTCDFGHRCYRFCWPTE